MENFMDDWNVLPARTIKQNRGRSIASLRSEHNNSISAYTKFTTKQEKILNIIDDAALHLVLKNHGQLYK